VTQAEKRFKYLLPEFRSDPTTFVGDANVHLVATLRRDHDLATRLRRLNRVVQIHDGTVMSLSSRQTQEMLGDPATPQDLFARNRGILVDSGLVHLPILAGWSLAEDSLNAS
jgi:hypothetical protein